MQLSVSTSPADSSLASTLLGGVPPCAAISGDGTTPFASLFPGLASTPQVGPAPVVVGIAIPPDSLTTATPIPEIPATGPVGMAPVATTDTPVVADDGPPAWVGSAQPQTVSAQISLRHSTGPQSPPAVATEELSAPTSDVDATVGGPAAGMPAVPTRPVVRTPAGARGPRRDAELPSRAAIQVPVDGVPLVASIAQPQPPVAAPPAEISINPTQESEPAISSEFSPEPVFPAVAPSIAQTVPTVSSSQPAPSPVASPTGESSPSTEEPSARKSVSGFAPSSRATAPRRSSASQTPAPTTPVGHSARRTDPFTAPMDQNLAETDLAPLDTLEPSVPVAELATFELADPELAAPETFAPSEILWRQFAPSVRPTMTNESPRVVTEPRAFSFASPLPMSTAAAVGLPQPSTPAVAVPMTPNVPTTAGLETTVESSELAAALPLTTSAESRDFAPAGRSEKMPVPRGAKIAAAIRYFSGEKNSEYSPSDKTFLNSPLQGVVERESTVGTGVAKPEVIMPSAPFNPSAIAAVQNHAPVQSVSVASADRSADFTSASVLAPEGADSAHRAVEAVLTAVDRFSAGERHSVNLNFSVGGADLHVRVELRADEVHATFRTDSPELRTALAREWQTVNGNDSGEHSQRVATPVFTTNSGSSDSSNLTSFSGGDGSARQRDSGARQARGESFEVATARGRGTRSTAPVSPTETVSTLSRPTSPSGPRRLLATA